MFVNGRGSVFSEGWSSNVSNGRKSEALNALDDGGQQPEIDELFIVTVIYCWPYKTEEDRLLWDLLWDFAVCSGSSLLIVYRLI